MDKDLIDRIKRESEVIEEEIISIRRHLHRNPELSMEERWTHDFIADYLESIDGIEVNRNLSEGTGVLGILWGKERVDKSVLLRADIDALPVYENKDFSIRSDVDGKMHACGHDGHISWILGAAKVLSNFKDEIYGCVKFLFQPGEEVGKGALPMIEKDGVLSNPDVVAAFSAHNWPSIERGKIAIANEYAFGCVGSFRVTVNGRGGHASWPHETLDPIACANEIYQQIHRMMSRKIPATDSALMSVTYFQAGDMSINNIIPDNCVFGGTMRSVYRETMEDMIHELENISKGISLAHGVDVSVDARILLDGVNNDENMVEMVKDIAPCIVGEDNFSVIYKDNLGGENFSEFSKRVPSAYMYIGVGKIDGEETFGLHSDKYEFDDGVLRDSISLFSSLAIESLSR